MVVRVLNPAVVLLAELVLRRIRIGVAPQPELLDESVPLLIVAQGLEGLGLFVGDDPDYILVEPGLVSALQLLLQSLLRLKLFLV
jgi:hypothetical protein